MLDTIRHYATKILLMLYGPAQLDEANDPIKAEDRRYEAAHHKSTAGKKPSGSAKE